VGVLSLSLALAGCAANHEISLDDFLKMQSARVATATDVGEGESEDSPVDRYLTAYHIGPNDVLEVTLTGLNEPTASSLYRARVGKQGQIDLPLVGVVQVGGMELADAESAIQAAYVPDVVRNARDLAVNIKVVTFDQTNVIVTGAALTPGLIPLRRTERNLLYAMAGAGGATGDASGRVTLSRVRRPGERVSFDLTDPAQLAAALEIAPLENGDIVRVEAATPNMVFVGGLVNRPGPQVLPPGARLSMLQLLASAGGLRTDVFPRAGTLLRRMPDGRDVRVKLNLNRIKSGEDENILLAAGDVLWVPETIETRVQDFINKNVFLRAGFSLNYTMDGQDFLNNAARRSTFNTGNTQNSFDPLGFLSRNAALQNLVARP